MRQEASFTVELAILLPVVMFVLFAPLHMGYRMYEQTKEKSVSAWDSAFCAEEKVRKIRFVENVWEGLK